MLAEWWSDIRYRLRVLWHRDAVEQELDLELRNHLDRETAKLVAAGLPATEAARQARIAFGGVESVKEWSRDTRGIRWFEVVSQDLRYAARSLRRNPGFTIGVVLTLALGIGANVAMFGIIDRLLFRTPAYLVDPDRVHRVLLAHDDRDGESISSTTQYARYRDLQRWTTSFDLMASVTTFRLPVGSGDATRETRVAIVSASLFEFFDAKPALGRFFTAAEDSLPAGERVAVLSHGFWQANYGGREDVIGQSLEIGSAQYRIIGVAPPRFAGASTGAPAALWIPITAYASTRRDPGAGDLATRYQFSWLSIIARRRPDITVAAADADLTRAYGYSWNNERILSPLKTPAEIAHPRAFASPVQDERGPEGRSPTTKVATWVSGVAAIVLLIACANVTNLLLARAIRRRREIALRLALGVGRRRLAGQLLTESLLLTGAGALGGLLLANVGAETMSAHFLPRGDPSISVIDPRILAFALGLALMLGVALGMVPVMQARRTDLVDSLKAGVREGGQRRSRMRESLLLLQVALSVVLLIGAGLFVQSLRNVKSLWMGYDVAPLLHVTLNLRSVKLDSAQSVALSTRMLETLRAMPEVESAALGATTPFRNMSAMPLFVSGVDSVNRLGDFTMQAGSPEYLRTVGTRILRGRGIAPEDRVNAPRVMVVSQSMARKLWPNQEALGQCVRVGADTLPCTTVVGIAEDIKEFQLTQADGLHYYLSLAQYRPEDGEPVVRVRGNADAHAESLRRVLQPLMPGNAYVTVSSMQSLVEPETRSWRLGTTMFVAFGGLALLLAAIGLYSVIAYDVAQRRRELGVRIALGATARNVMQLVVGGALRVTAAGGMVGACVALVAGKWIAPLLFDTSPRDPVVYGIVSTVLLAAAVLASAVPALRALRVDPNEALRAE